MAAEVRYHLSPATGRPNRCYASRGCPLGANAPHFSSKEEARAFFEGAQAHATLQTVSKKKQKSTPVPPPSSLPTDEKATPLPQEGEDPSSTEEDLPLEDAPEEELAAVEDDLMEEDFADDVYASTGEEEDECENCGDPQARYRVDPYEESVHGRTVYRNLCSSCYEELASTY